MKILTGNDEIVNFTVGKHLEIIPHYYDNVFMGYNLMLENDLIDTYDDEEYAVLVMSDLCRRIDKKQEFVSIEKINKLLEV